MNSIYNNGHLQGHQEIERKWLIRRLPESSLGEPLEILQGYIAVTPNGNEVRLRMKGGRYFLTVKTSGNQVRGETEIELQRDEFEVLWPATEGARLHKNRYNLRYRGFTIEVDIYAETLSGLVIAEVEFGSEQEAAAFEPPEWFGEELTMDNRYKNKNLAMYGCPKE